MRTREALQLVPPLLVFAAPIVKWYLSTLSHDAANLYCGSSYVALLGVVDRLLDQLARCCG